MLGEPSEAAACHKPNNDCPFVMAFDVIILPFQPFPFHSFMLSPATEQRPLLLWCSELLHRFVECLRHRACPLQVRDSGARSSLKGSWVRAAVGSPREGSEVEAAKRLPVQLILLRDEGRGTQVVRERSAKPLCVGSIPTRASKFFFVVAVSLLTFPACLAHRP